MKFFIQKKRLVVALMLAGPLTAYAQTVVPPPVMPGEKPLVAAPAQVNSVQPGIRSTNQADLIDIALPAASPALAPPAEVKESLPLPAVKAPVAAETTSLKTPAKASTKAPASTKVAPQKAPVAQHVKVEKDPFAGLILTPVSDSQLNRFTFPEPIEGIYFSEGAPLPECPEDAGPQDPCKPVFLNGKKMMLLQFRAGAKGPVQMLAHLQSGRVITLNLAPGPGPGALVRVEGAADGASDSRLAKGAMTRQGAAQGLSTGLSENNVDLLSRFARGDVPGEFEQEGVGDPVRFEYFDVIPVTAWGNGDNLKVHLFQIRGHGNTPVAINSSLFRTENVQALALDRDTITYDAPALLYMLEYIPEAE